MNNTITLPAPHLSLILLIFMAVGEAGGDHGESRTGRLYIKEVNDCFIWSAWEWWRKLKHCADSKVEPVTGLHSLLVLFVFVTVWGSPSIRPNRTDTVMEIKKMLDSSFMHTYLLRIILKVMFGCWIKGRIRLI